MKVHQFLDHYGITENPFAQEDAQSDPVFQQHCLTGTHHSAWDKIYGSPNAPSTSVVFGEQGSGKTALRLQMMAQLREYNREHVDDRAFIVEYDDFNPFLDCFRERLSGRRRRPERALQNWRLWDHMDAILTLATTRLADAIRDDGRDPHDKSHALAVNKLDGLSHQEKRDVMLLAALYDNNRELSARQKWQALRRKLRYNNWKTWWDVGLGAGVTILTILLVLWLSEWRTLLNWWVPTIIVVGWLPFLWHQAKLSWLAWRVSRQIRVLDHETSALRKVLSNFERSDLAGQPVPSRPRGDDRYELLLKLQGVLRSLGFTSIFVLVDRVDEPHLVNGSPERIRDLLWPMFDNKFLKHPGMAFKLLLPANVAGYLQRQEREFYERSRLDKQNLIHSLTWTGQGLYDIANDRIRACAELAEGNKPGIGDFFEESVTTNDLIGIFDRLRAPRHLFKFLYRLLIDHCSKYTEDHPEWKIRRETLQSSLAVFMRDLEAYEQGRGTG
ncbi:MAG: hypothetical protein ACF8PG_17185 [Maioricimonas sp. JB045]